MYKTFNISYNRFTKLFNIFLSSDFIFGQIGSFGYPEKLKEIHEIEVVAMVEDVVSRQTITQCGQH